MAGSWIDGELWKTVIGPDQFNDQGAIYKYWRELRAEGTYLGVPVTPEIGTPVGTQQGFSSGAVINFDPASGASLASE